MEERDGDKLDAHQFERGVHDVQVDTWDGALRRCSIKDVGEGAANHAKGFFRAVDRERRFLADVERANVVEAEDVVGVAVGEQDGVEAIEADAEGLLAEIGCGVDDDVLAVARKQEGGAQAVIVRIFRGADAAIACERGHAHGGAGAEYGDFYGSGGHFRTKLYRRGGEVGKFTGGGKMLGRLYRTGGEVQMRRQVASATKQSLRASLGFGLLRGLSGYGLIDLEIGHFEFAEEIEEERVFLGGQVAVGFFA